MPFSLSMPSPETMKAEARALREERDKAGTPIAHSAALEEVARLHGYRDWNTARAALPERFASPANLGDKVSGTYLGQSFTGTVLATSVMAGASLFKLTIHFDQPVDVVTFESFSAFRQRVNVRVDAYGISPDRTSNGEPHMRLDLKKPKR